jgi:ectoine hydroxylase-related dioxygenase (phytanoyl-CoA dioxygenase family)
MSSESDSERRAFATQTLSFWRGSAQGAHQDSAYVNYSLPMQFLASWIALEDVSPDSGELFYYVGSHRMPEFLYIDRFKGVEEAGRLNPGFNLQPQIRHHVQRIPIVAAEMKLPARQFLAKRGDILIWSADLAHGGSPISTTTTRKSVVTHYTTAEAVPSYFELHPGKVRASYRGDSYSSAHYDFQPREAHRI